MPTLPFRSASSNSEDSSADLTLVITKPANTAQGDLLVAVLSKNGSGNPYADPSGWTVLERQTNVTAPASTSMLVYKWAGSSEPANYTFGPSAGSVPTLQGGIACYQGPQATPGFDDSGSTNDGDVSDTSVDAPSITVSVAPALVIRAFVDTTQVWTASDSALNARERLQVAGTTNARRVAIYDEDKEATGASGTQTATVPSASTKMAYTAAFIGDPVVSDPGPDADRIVIPRVMRMRA